MKNSFKVCIVINMITILIERSTLTLYLHGIIGAIIEEDLHEKESYKRTAHTRFCIFAFVDK